MKFARSLRQTPYSTPVIGSLLHLYVGGLIYLEKIWDEPFTFQYLSGSVVGFDPVSEAFKVKTSFGSKYGENGYARVNWEAAHGMGICTRGTWMI